MSFLFSSEYDCLKIKSKSKTSILDFAELHLIEEIKIHLVNEINWYAKQFKKITVLSLAKDADVSRLKSYFGIIILIKIIYKPSISM